MECPDDCSVLGRAVTRDRHQDPAGETPDLAKEGQERRPRRNAVTWVLRLRVNQKNGVEEGILRKGHSPHEVLT